MVRSRIRVKRYEIEILLDYRRRESDDARDGIDIIELGREKFDRFKISDVTFDSITRVISSLTDCRDEVTFDVEADDLLLVGLTITDELNGPASREMSSVE